MPIIELAANLEDMQEYEPLPAAGYISEVRAVETKFSDAQPLGYFNISLLVHPDEYPADYDVINAPEGTPLSYARVSVPDPSNPRSVGPMKAWLRAIGLPTRVDAIDTDEWVGKNCRVFVKPTVFQGRPVNNVENVTAISQV